MYVQFILMNTLARVTQLDCF